MGSPELDSQLQWCFASSGGQGPGRTDFAGKFLQQHGTFDNQDVACGILRRTISCDSSLFWLTAEHWLFRWTSRFSEEFDLPPWSFDFVWSFDNDFWAAEFPSHSKRKTTIKNLRVSWNSLSVWSIRVHQRIAVRNLVVLHDVWAFSCALREFFVEAKEWNLSITQEKYCDERHNC